LAAPDADRAADLTEAWGDPGVAAVFCARGGYGVHRMVDLLDWDTLAEAGPKALVGFSDVTAMHQAFAMRLGASTIHGPVVTSLGSGDDASREHLRRLLFAGTVPPLTPEPVEVLVPGRADGVLVGGNVALLAAGTGTSTYLPAAGSIAVLEDVDEEPYRLDRMVTHLLRSGWFEGVRGIALGRFTRCGEQAEVRALLEERLTPLGVPMLWGVPVGHEDPNLAFPLGLPAVLDADAGTLAVPGRVLR
jgi:muramoyltetrapeptide carboxypeptidase